MLIFNHRTSQAKLLVYFIRAEKSIPTEEIKGFATKMREEDIANGLIVSNRELSPSADKLIREIGAQSHFHIEHFLIRELLLNITNHELVPKHIVVGEEEKAAVLAKYRIKESQLPKILVSDPVAKYLGLRPRQLVKIVRTSETAGLHVVYRIAI